jgi:hypothetical protein
VYTVVYWPVEAVKRDVYTGYRSDLKGKSRTREEKSTGNIWVGISEFSAIRIFVQESSQVADHDLLRSHPFGRFSPDKSNKSRNRRWRIEVCPHAGFFPQQRSLFFQQFEVQSPDYWVFSGQSNPAFA